MACTITINIDGQEILFHTERELDAWLSDPTNNVEKYYDPKLGKVTYSSTTARENALNIINDVRTKWQNWRNNNYSGNPELWVTTVLNIAGSRQNIYEPVLSRNFDRVDARNALIAANIQNPTEEQIRQKLEEWRRTGERMSSLGTAIHAKLDWTFTDDKKTRDSRLQKNNEWVRLGFAANEDAQKKIERQVINEIENYLKTVHGDDYQTYSEFSIGTTNVNSTLRKIVKQLTDLENNSRLKDKEKETLQKIQQLAESDNFALGGKIDMFVVDKDGKVSLYDFKTSNKSYDNWSQEKKDAAMLQLYIYKAMLEQVGLDVKEVGIIPIIVTDSNEVDKIEYRVGTTDSSGNSLAVVRGANPEYASIAEQFIPVQRKVKSEVIDTVNRKIGTVFPGHSVSFNDKQRKVEIEYFKKNHLYTDDQGTYFFDNVAKRQRGLSTNQRAPKIYITKGSEDAIITEYLERFNKMLETEYFEIGKQLSALCENPQGAQEFLERLFSNVSWKSRDTNVRLFLPYITDGWSLVKDETGWLNGIYMFEKRGHIQIIYLSGTRNLGHVHDWNGGTSIFANTLRDDQIDKRFDLELTAANMNLMKMMCYISENDYFHNKKVLGITVKHIAEKQIFHESNDLLMQNWKKLVLESDKKAGTKTDLKTFDERIMLDDVSASLWMTNVLLANVGYWNATRTPEKVFENKQANIEKTLAELERILNFLKNKYYKDVPLTSIVDRQQLQSSQYKAIVAISKAILSLKGLYTINELNWGQYAEWSRKMMGQSMVPHYLSDSANLRVLDEIAVSYFDTIKHQFYTRALSWQKQMKRAAKEWRKKYPNYINLAGGEFYIFEDWFQRGHDGNQVNPDLILRAPEDVYFNGDDMVESKKLLTMFLDEINLMRYGLTYDQMVAADRQMEALQVPLMRAPFIEQITNAIKNEKGIAKKFTSIKQETRAWIKRKFEAALANVDDAELDKETLQDLNDLDQERLDNIYFQIDQEERTRLLQGQEGRYNMYERSLDSIFLRALAEDVKVKASEKHLPMFTALRVLLHYNSAVNNQKNDQIRKEVEEYVRSRVFRQNIVDEKLQSIDAVFRFLRGIVSNITLGLNVRNLTRETVIGLITSAKESFMNKVPELFPVPIDPEKQLSEKNKFFTLYSKYFSKVLLSTTKMNDTLSLIQQLNAMYHMVDYSTREMPHTAEYNRFKLFNLSEDMLYITSELPDYYHRNAILMASLEYLGAWDAHTYNEETEELIYDMAKDKRYKILFDHDFDRTKVPNNKKVEYDTAYHAYIEALNEWKLAGYNYNIGDKFERALTPKEAANVVNFGDVMFGCYDADRNAMIRNHFLGSLFFQFKTYVMNQAIQYLRPNGAINIRHRHFVTDPETGEQMYDVVNDDEEFRRTGRSERRVRASEVSQEDIDAGRARPAVNYASAPMEGMLRSVLRIPMLVIRWDQETFNKYWENPVNRSNIFMSIFDLLFGVMLMLVAQLLFGTTQDLKDSGWIQRWSYSVLTGVAENGLIWEIGNSIYGDGIPPMVSSLQQYYNNAVDLMLGDKNILYALANTFGATKQFAPIFQ